MQAEGRCRCKVDVGRFHCIEGNPENLTDLPGGDRPTLGKSIRRLMKLPDHTVVWPGHDYGPTPSSTIGWEKRNNVNAKEYGYYVEDGVL
jgi:glyoxylase-like metal-dependent hydrolase (beta-lactamase superfamily II)